MPVRPARLTLMLVGWNRHQAKLSQGLYGCFPGHGVLSNGSQKRCNSAEWAPLFFAAVQFCTWALLVGACATLEHPKGTGPVLGRFRIWDAAFIKRLLRSALCKLYTFNQGPLGQVSVKPTTFLCIRIYRQEVCTGRVDL